MDSGLQMNTSEHLDRLKGELDQMDTMVRRGLELIQPALILAPESLLVTQLFRDLNTIGFFVIDSRQRIEQISTLLIPSTLRDEDLEDLSDLSESLSDLLSRIWETKVRLEQIVIRWEDQT